MPTPLRPRPPALHALRAARPMAATVLAVVLAVPSASAAVLEGFESPALPDKTHQYRPTGGAWTFAGATGAGLQRNGSPFNAPAAPQGKQTAFLKSHDGSATRTVTLAPGTYTVSFWAARRASAPGEANPVQVFLNGAAVGTPVAPATAAFARYTTARVTVPAHGTYPLKVQTTRAGEFTTLLDGVTVDLVNPFDSLYGSTFQLPPVAADPIPAVPKPASKANSLNSPSYVDPVYGTRVYRATAPSDLAGALFVRHEYSRRQAFNANNTRYLAQSNKGNWLVYDAATFTVQGAPLAGLAGDCEAIWHPTDPALLWHTATNGGLVWHERNVETQATRVLHDFTASIQARWPKATRLTTAGEGTSSADGRYFAFLATDIDAANQTVIHGLVTWDRATGKILGMLDASAFNGLMPNHIGISPSGRYAVPSWVDTTLGTRAYPVDFATPPRKLINRSEHSDLAIGPDGQDYFVVADYEREMLRAIDLDTGGAFDIMPTRPRTGSGYAMHISGQAFDRPGWALVSTYDDYGNYSTYPDTTVEPMYRKLMLVELRPQGKRLSVAHTRAAAGLAYAGYQDGHYFGEHHATISRDGSRLMFATNFNDQGPPSSYVVGVPSWVYAPSAGGTATPPPASSAPLAITGGPVSRSGYSGTFRVGSTVPAACRMGTQPGVPYAALYDGMSATQDGRVHDKTTGFATTGPQTVHVRCVSSANLQDEQALVVNFP